MSTKNNIIGAGIALAAAGLLGAYALADQGHGQGQGGGMGRMGMGSGPGHGKMQGHGQERGEGRRFGNMTGDIATRLDAARTEIGLKPEQTAAWDAYTSVIKAHVADRQAHRTAVDHDAVQKMAPKDREDFRAKMMQGREEEQAKVRKAADEFIAKLDTAQAEKAKRVLPGLATAEHDQGQGRGMRQGMAQGNGGGHGRGQH